VNSGSPEFSASSVQSRWSRFNKSFLKGMFFSANVSANVILLDDEGQPSNPADPKIRRRQIRNAFT